MFFRIFWLWDEEGVDTIFIWMGLIIIFSSFWLKIWNGIFTFHLKFLTLLSLNAPLVNITVDQTSSSTLLRDA